jgi:hypothetical protein
MPLLLTFTQCLAEIHALRTLATQRIAPKSSQQGPWSEVEPRDRRDIFVSASEVLRDTARLEEACGNRTRCGR